MPQNKKTLLNKVLVLSYHVSVFSFFYSVHIIVLLIINIVYLVVVKILIVPLESDITTVYKYLPDIYYIWK